MKGVFALQTVEGCVASVGVFALQTVVEMSCIVAFAPFGCRAFPDFLDAQFQWGHGFLVFADVFLLLSKLLPLLFLTSLLFLGAAGLAFTLVADLQANGDLEFTCASTTA